MSCNLSVHLWGLSKACGYLCNFYYYVCNFIINWRACSENQYWREKEMKWEREREGAPGHCGTMWGQRQKLQSQNTTEPHSLLWRLPHRSLQLSLLAQLGEEGEERARRGHYSAEINAQVNFFETVNVYPDTVAVGENNWQNQYIGKRFLITDFGSSMSQWHAKPLSTGTH